MTSSQSIWLFNDGLNFCLGVPYTAGTPVRISGELAAKLGPDVRTIDALTAGYCIGTKLTPVTIVQEPERQSCLLTAGESRDGEAVLMEFACAVVEAAIIRQAGGAEFRVGAAAVKALQGRRRALTSPVSDNELWALSKAARALGKPYNGCMPGQLYWAMYEVDANGVEAIHRMAADLASPELRPEQRASRIACLGKQAAGYFAEALEFKRRNENTHLSGADVNRQLGGEISYGEALINAASRTKYDPGREQKRGSAQETADQNELLERLINR